MTSFKLAFHGVTSRRMIEIFDDAGEFIGAIYPTSDGSNGIHIVSAHFDQRGAIEASKSALPIPGFLIKFRRQQQ